MKPICNFDDFCEELLRCGFTPAGSGKGVFSLLWSWNELAPYPTPVRWHTGDPVTDPWQWRLRAVTQRDDIAYGKVFFSAAGYITKQWYPYFLAVRRQGLAFDDFYQDGKMTRCAKKIYDLLCENGPMATHEIKKTAQFDAAEKHAADRALVDLQKSLFITVSSSLQKVDRFGIPYGWESMVFSTVEQFWDDALFQQAAALNPKEAYAAIEAQVLLLNPDAPPKALSKFILGS